MQCASQKLRACLEHNLGNYKSTKIEECTLEFLFPKFCFGTIGFRLGDGIGCLEPEAQNAVLSLEVAKIQFSN